MCIWPHRLPAVQEYLGSYVADASGRLTFKEGALVTAVRRGLWVLLDELNLAPSDVLEALNRWASVCVLALGVPSSHTDALAAVLVV